MPAWLCHLGRAIPRSGHIQVGPSRRRWSTDAAPAGLRWLTDRWPGGTIGNEAEVYSG